MDPIIKEYANDNRWMFPYLDYGLHTSCNFSQLCNEERRRSLPLILNHQKHTSASRDTLLKVFYDKHLPIKWLASVSDISMLTISNHYTGSILLNHLVENKGNVFETLFILNRSTIIHGYKHLELNILVTKGILRSPLATLSLDKVGLKSIIRKAMVESTTVLVNLLLPIVGCQL